MGLSLSELIRRARLKIESLSKEELRLNEAVVVAQGKIAVCKSEKRQKYAELGTLISRLEKRKADGLKLSRMPMDEMSSDRGARFRQALNLVCDENEIRKPEWIRTISDSDVRHFHLDDLLDRYVLSDEGIGPSLNREQREALAEEVAKLMAGLKRPSVKSENIFDLHPDFIESAALELASQFRAEAGLSAELAIQVSNRAMAISTAWCRSTETGEWLDDVALRLMARVRTIDGDRGSRDEKAAGVIESYLNKDKVRSSAENDNARLLTEAVAVYATPGAIAQAYRAGLGDEERSFCSTWFGDNRDFVAELGHKVGSALAFSNIVKDSVEFRARHFGAAPKSDPKEARIWARGDHDVHFRREEPRDLIEEARHALVDTTLHSSLVSMPKKRDHLLDLGPWEANEIIHRETIDVSSLVTKAFKIEARDAAEIEAMQGTNPLAITVGLVTWTSVDGKTREAPLFLALVDFDEGASVVRRKTQFTLNRSLFQRIKVDYPAIDKKASIFDALGAISFQSPVRDVFTRVSEAIAARTTGKSPIVKIEDSCFVGSFDSSRAVLERRLDLKVFPDLVANPVVRLLAEGSKEQIVYGEYDQKGARSPSDEIQGLAVRAVLGGTSFVLEGPPGTGKTNTIVSMLEALNKAGKTALVSAAMPGAIEVIGRRINRAFSFSVCSMKDGQIDVGAATQKVNLRDFKSEVVIGTPMALIKDLPSDAKFDVLIVDEASQLRLSHALSLAGHVRQIVIAGDSRQLQPHDDKTGKTSEQSLLTRARQAAFPAIMLENHYRSRHPSLIAWSNLFSYGSRLKPRKAPYLLGDAGFDVIYVSTGRRLTYKGAQVNVEEAKRIAEEVVRWARDGRRTVGVAALTQAQRDLIRTYVDTAMLKAGISLLERQTEERLLEMSEGAKRPIGFFSSKEPFFIRTAGSVQGEERDVMLISLGVARDAEGKLHQSAGALGRADALALTNVMLSRARMRTVVFSSLTPWDINVSSMTPGMFLIASILRMATVASMPETSSTDVHPTFLSDEWSVEKFMLGKDRVYAIRLPTITDKYAMAIVFRNRNDQIPAALAVLENAGWDVALFSSILDPDSYGFGKQNNVDFRNLIRMKLSGMGLIAKN